jgi:hypothetical protein
VTWRWYYFKIAQMNFARLERQLHRTELTHCSFGEPMTDELRAKQFFDAGQAWRSFMPMGQILMRDATKIMDMPVVGIVLGSAEQDVAGVPPQKIGVHHQIGHFRERMLRFRQPKVGVDLFNGVLHRRGSWTSKGARCNCEILAQVDRSDRSCSIRHIPGFCNYGDEVRRGQRAHGLQITAPGRNHCKYELAINLKIAMALPLQAA